MDTTLASNKYGPNNYIIIHERSQDYHRKSFFIRSAELCNSFPSEIKSTNNSLTMFKTSLLQFSNFICLWEKPTPLGFVVIVFNCLLCTLLLFVICRLSYLEGVRSQ